MSVSAPHSAEGKVAAFKKRRVGKTGLEVTELGIGSATFPGQLGVKVPIEGAQQTVEDALAAGVRYFDSAPMYGFGLSEHVVGDALRFRDGDVVLSTKVGRLLHPLRSESDRAPGSNPWTQPFPFSMTYDYSYDAVMRSFEASLNRLGLGKIDILLVHDIGVQTHGAEVNARHWKALGDSGYRALSELKAQGLVSAIGLGVNEVDILMDAFKIGDWDIHLLANRYTLLEQTPLDTLYAECQKRGTSMLAAGPFAGGILAGTDIWGPPTGVYAKAPPDVVAKVEGLRVACRAHNVPLGAAALQFALAHPVIASVLTGPKSPEELKGILAWWNAPIPGAFWDQLADERLVAPGTPLPNGRTA
jgi:D-threo-aldose 1-dehydrogenase